VAIEIGEISGITAPKYVLRLLDEFGPSSESLGHHPIDTFFGGFVVSQGDPAKVGGCDGGIDDASIFG